VFRHKVNLYVYCYINSRIAISIELSVYTTCVWVYGHRFSDAGQFFLGCTVPATFSLKVILDLKIPDACKYKKNGKLTLCLLKQAPIFLSVLLNIFFKFCCSHSMLLDSVVLCIVKQFLFCFTTNFMCAYWISLDSLVLANNDKPENQSGSENAIIITIKKYFKRFNYAIGIVMTKLA
jgi:hypothetical protein